MTLDLHRMREKVERGQWSLESIDWVQAGVNGAGRAESAGFLE